jgi:hypothetical protein
LRVVHVVGGGDAYQRFCKKKSVASHKRVQTLKRKMERVKSALIGAWKSKPIQSTRRGSKIKRAVTMR